VRQHDPTRANPNSLRLRTIRRKNTRRSTRSVSIAWCFRHQEPPISSHHQPRSSIEFAKACPRKSRRHREVIRTEAEDAFPHYGLIRCRTNRDEQAFPLFVVVVRYLDISKSKTIRRHYKVGDHPVSELVQRNQEDPPDSTLQIPVISTEGGALCRAEWRNEIPVPCIPLCLRD